MRKRGSVPHQMKPNQAGEQFQRKNMGEHYMLYRTFSDYSHFPQHHISSFLNCELFCPVSLNIADCQQHGPGALLLKLENPPILLCCAIFQQFTACSFFFTLCSCHLPDAECPIRLMLLSQKTGSKVGGRSIWQTQFYTFCEKRSLMNKCLFQKL